MNKKFILYMILAIICFISIEVCITFQLNSTSIDMNNLYEKLIVPIFKFNIFALLFFGCIKFAILSMEHYYKEKENG